MQQQIPIAAEREILFRLEDAGGNAITGATFSGSEIQIRKAGGAFASFAGSYSEVTGSPGLYAYVCSIPETDTPGKICLKVAKTGAILVLEYDEIVRAKFGVVQAGTLGASAFTTSLTDLSNAWKNVLCRFITGSLAMQSQLIGSYASSGGLITLGTGLAFTGAPAPDDVFEIVTN